MTAHETTPTNAIPALIALAVGWRRELMRRAVECGDWRYAVAAERLVASIERMRARFNQERGA